LFFVYFLSTMALAADFNLADPFPALVLALPATGGAGGTGGTGATLAALLAALPGRRGAARDAGAADAVLRVLRDNSGKDGKAINRKDAQGIVAPALLLLAQLVDDAALGAARAADAAAAAVVAMRAFPEHREVQAAGANVLFVCAADHASACEDAGARDALSAAAALKHFANLEVGVRHPFRFKLGIVDAALRRLTHVP
jgi:hypothetical protein